MPTQAVPKLWVWPEKPAATELSLLPPTVLLLIRLGYRMGDGTGALTELALIVDQAGRPPAPAMRAIDLADLAGVIFIAHCLGDGLGAPAVVAGVGVETGRPPAAAMRAIDLVDLVGVIFIVHLFGDDLRTSTVST